MRAEHGLCEEHGDVARKSCLRQIGVNEARRRQWFTQSHFEQVAQGERGHS